MKKYKTLEDAQIGLIELLEAEGKFQGTPVELAERLSIGVESVKPLLQSLKASGDIAYEEVGSELVVKPAFFTPALPPVLTEEQQKDAEDKIKKGYKLISCSHLGGVQSRELRTAVGKRVTVYLRNGSRVEGRLKGFDRFCLKLRNYMGNLLIYKHAVSSIVYKP